MSFVVSILYSTIASSFLYCVLLRKMRNEEPEHKSGSESLNRIKMNTRQRLTCTNLTLFTLTAVTLQIIGLSLFVFGFFPVKPTLSGFSGVESFYPPGCNSVQNDTASGLPRQQIKSLFKDLSEIPPVYNRLILMVIDGLPAEFVLGKDGNPPQQDFAEAMPYTRSLLENGAAVGFHAKAAPPTVTMPRLKALVSGAIGGFLDVAFNFNTQAMVDDNVLDQLFRIGWKMVMLGDETWLKLFPTLFMRHDGVSSFYVKDTVQVDQNVSRHLGHELSRNDWNLLILHYLGLDHVGHIGGRNSYLMAPKLKDMDDVIKMIHLNTIKTCDNDQGNTLLVVVSDHGMTKNGNHGGSSYEETDSLALFIGIKSDKSDISSASDNFVYQVDIAPTIALLFGVPIPKNNVGVLILETFYSLTDEEKLRALELNSWQLLRLVKAQLPGLSCGSSCEGTTDALVPRRRECSGSTDSMLCCLYQRATDLHTSWRSKKIHGSNNMDDYKNSSEAYHKFLSTAREWLSRRVTDKPIALLAFGIVAMAIACLILLNLIIYLDKEQNLPNLSNRMLKWHLEDAFTVGVVFALFLSMGSSSMVEEEHYIWHFMVSTLYLILLWKTVQCFSEGSPRNLLKYLKGQNESRDYQFFTIILLLISGRILRGWHQGGVNWTHLPDISKWLEQVCGGNLTSIQLTSGLLVICLGMFALASFGPWMRYFHLMRFWFLLSGSLVVWYVMEYRDSTVVSSSYGSNVLAQIIYAVLGAIVVGTAVVLPWFTPVWITGTCSKHNANSVTSDSISTRDQGMMMESRDFSYIIGLSYVFCWCLLQLLLQQPINSVPIFLLFAQILATMLYYSHNGHRSKEWVEVASLYYLGMAGHFALGNTNTLATIDVAGAFIGLSNHSTVFSGILMFIITYASPMLFLLSMVMYNSMKHSGSLSTSQNVHLGHLLKARLGFPCLVPLCVNSILLTGYTVVLLLMRNHLFVWSVFSPKYLYVCATTICVYVGLFLVTATEIYTCLILKLRKKRRASIR